MLDIEALRADTPGSQVGVFLDSAGSSLPPRVVVDTVVGHIEREAHIGGYRAAAERDDDLAALRTRLGRLIGASADAIALSDSASRSYADVFGAVPLKAGDRILISQVEYASNAILAINRARKLGARVELMPSDPTGQIDVGATRALLDDRVRLVSIVHSPTNSGLLNPVRQIADAAHEVDAFVMLDACQSVGQVAVNVDELRVDALSATGRKWLRGPRGTGFAYVRPERLEALEPAVIDHSGAEWVSATEFRITSGAARFELWESNIADRLGLGAAVKYLLDLGPENVFAAIAQRACAIRNGLAALDHVQLRDLGVEQGGIVSFTVDGVEPTQVRDFLAAHDVTVTVSPPGATRLDMTLRGLSGVVRASAHCFVSDADIDRFLALMTERSNFL